jgi:hypothetical protein
MSEQIFELAPDLALWVKPTERLVAAFYNKYGASSPYENTEAGDQALAEMLRALERAGRHIQRLFRSTGNLAVIGDKLDLRLPAVPTSYRLQVANREILTYLEEDYMAICYYFCLDDWGCYELGAGTQIPRTAKNNIGQAI